VLIPEFDSALEIVGELFVAINYKDTREGEILSYKNEGAILIMEKKLIILVDDNPVNLKIGKFFLSEKFSVATAPSAEKLFSLLENNQPNLILLDIDMPDMDGYETIEILKSKPETKDIPVIFLTGMAKEAKDEVKGRSMGAVDYIIKPFDPPKLIECIEKHIKEGSK